MPSNKSIKRDVFDFEIGHLLKSPCIECENRNNSPKCIDNCRILEEVRTRLARGISCSRAS